MPVKSEETIRATISEKIEEINEVEQTPLMGKEQKEYILHRLSAEIGTLCWALDEESGLEY